VKNKKAEYLAKAKDAGRQGDKEMYDYWMDKAREEEKQNGNESRRGV